MKVKLFPYSPASDAGADADSNASLFSDHIKAVERELNAFLKRIEVRHVILLPGNIISIWYDGETPPPSGHGWAYAAQT